MRKILALISAVVFLYLVDKALDFVNYWTIEPDYKIEIQEDAFGNGCSRLLIGENGTWRVVRYDSWQSKNALGEMAH
jgi:hypothetical protein